MSIRKEKGPVILARKKVHDVAPIIEAQCTGVEPNVTRGTKAQEVSRHVLTAVGLP